MQVSSCNDHQVTEYVSSRFIVFHAVCWACTLCSMLSLPPVIPSSVAIIIPLPQVRKLRLREKQGGEGVCSVSAVVLRAMVQGPRVEAKRERP